MAKKKVEGEKKEGAVLILVGAASLSSGEERFVKGVPKKVEDPELVKRLLASGLFKEAGESA